ncbi:hypothetical protein VNO77_08823 [Canavalia gladiata]|uniref:Uncharacterized protein n=1 Tax=Canavalia gladiata TaxID=3824 RepID=A0AAN9R158_CANGL
MASMCELNEALKCRKPSKYASYPKAQGAGFTRPLDKQRLGDRIFNGEMPNAWVKSAMEARTDAPTVVDHRPRPGPTQPSDNVQSVKKDGIITGQQPRVHRGSKWRKKPC